FNTRLLMACGLLCGAAFVAGASAGGNDANYGQVVIGTHVEGAQLNTGRQFQVAQVQGLAQLQIGNIDFDEFRQVLRQTHDFNFSQQVGNDTAAHFHAYAGIFVEEVQRYVHVQLVGCINALEVHVNGVGLGRVALQVFQYDLNVVAVQLQGQYVRVERFAFQ